VNFETTKITEKKTTPKLLIFYPQQNPFFYKTKEKIQTSDRTNTRPL